MHQDLRNPQTFRDSTTMLAARTTKRGETMGRGIVPPGLCKSEDRPRHGFVGDVNEPVRNFLGGHFLVPVFVDFGGEVGEEGFGDGGIERLVFVFAKYFGEELREEAAQEKVCVCYRQWSSFSIYKIPRQEQEDNLEIEIR